MFNRRSKLEKRVARMTNADLVSWVEVTGHGMTKALDDFSDQDRIESLTELKDGLAQLTALITEMELRWHDRHSVQNPVRSVE